MKALELVNLGIGLAALSLSGFLAWETQLKEKLVLSFVGSTDWPQIVKHKGNERYIHDVRYTFFNEGNRPISITALYMIIRPAVSVVKDSYCADRDTTSLPINAKEYHPVIEPFVIESGEIVTKEFHINRVIDNEIRSFKSPNTIYFHACTMIEMAIPRYGSLTKVIRNEFVTYNDTGRSLGSEVTGPSVAGFEPAAYPSRRHYLLNETHVGIQMPAT